MAVLKNLPRLLALVALSVARPDFILAQTEATAEVEVRTVQFAEVRARGANTPWLETTVELVVRPGASGGVYARYADRVRVSLSLAVRKRVDGFEFFRSSTELVALEAGRSMVRFYLPPEILEREQVNRDPYAYLVEVVAPGQPVRTGAAAILREASALQSFKDRVARFAPMNDGILRPQGDSPFSGEYAGDTPTAVYRPR